MIKLNVQYKEQTCGTESCLALNLYDKENDNYSNFIEVVDNCLYLNINNEDELKDFVDSKLTMILNDKEAFENFREIHILLGKYYLCLNLNTEIKKIDSKTYEGTYTVAVVKNIEDYK